MKTKFYLISFVLVHGLISHAQELPYSEIPDYPDSYTAGTVAARLVDGLGVRYYWATEGLREEDLAYRPETEARSCVETIDHIWGLSQIIVNATRANQNIVEESPVSFEEKRRQTLYNLKTAADILRVSSSAEMETYDIIFGSGEDIRKYPFWNNINGPIADALWHCGQVVSFRRSSGNPFDSRFSLFNGRLRE